MKLPRIDRASLESSQINLDALYAIAPSCFTEVKGDDGQLTCKVDFDALRERATAWRGTRQDRVCCSPL